MRLSERVYRALLKVYPKRYRERFGEQMGQLFADQLRASDTPKKFARVWLRTLADLARTVPARHLEPPAPHGHPFGSWSTSARRSVFYARYEASSFGRREITIEDLLLGMLRENRQSPELAAARGE